MEETTLTRTMLIATLCAFAQSIPEDSMSRDLTELEKQAIVLTADKDIEEILSAVSRFKKELKQKGC